MLRGGGVVALIWLALLLLPSVAPAYIFWSNENNNALGRDTNDGSTANLDQSFVANANQAKGVAIDNSYIYWANYGGNSIGRAQLDGSNANPNFIVGASNPEGVAVDSGHIYWANSTASGTTIGRANINGTGVNQSFITGASFPVGVAVDSNFIYWANFQGNGGSGSIGRANLNGSGVNQTWIATPGPGGVAVDGNFVYWTRFSLSGSILRASVTDGSGAQTIVTGASFPIEVATDGTYLYWTNRATTGTVCGGPGTCTVGRARLDGSGPDQNFITGASTVWGLAVGLPPGLISVPTIAGSPTGGDALSEGHGSWSNGPTAFVYQWLRCDTTGGSCVAVSGATAPSYGLGPADVGATMRVQEAAFSLQGGYSAIATSSPTAIVSAPAAPSDLTTPAVRGTAVQGQTLSESHGSWSESPSRYSVQWLRCNATGGTCSSIAGATGQSYVITNPDVGTTLRTREVATDQYGDSGVPALSNKTGVIRPLAPKVSHLSASGSVATTAVTCAGPPHQTCDGSVTALTYERLRHGRVVALTASPANLPARVVKVIAAHAIFHIPTGTTTRVRIPLNRVAASLLGRFYSVPTTLAFSDNAVGLAGIRFYYPVTTSAPNTNWTNWTWLNLPCGPCYTTVNMLTIHGVLAGAQVKLHCSGVGCPGDRVFRPRKRTLALASVFAGHRLEAGAVISISVTARGAVGRFVAYRVRAGRAPLLGVRCQPPGHRRPVACPAAAS